MSLTKNIILTGFMGTGKTTVGKEIARIVQAPFIDVDDIVESAACQSISNIIRSKGEAYFRKLESDAIENLREFTGSVIATGGGAVLLESNFTRLNSLGIIFCLDTQAEVLFKRLRFDNHRPLLASDDREKHLTDLLNQRMPYYRKITYHIDTSNVDSHRAALLIVDNYRKIIRANGNGI